MGIIMHGSAFHALDDDSGILRKRADGSVTLGDPRTQAVKTEFADGVIELAPEQEADLLARYPLAFKQAPARKAEEPAAKQVKHAQNKAVKRAGVEDK